MLITGVTVEGVGRFERRSSIRGLGAGINVLAAGNEAGKSTLFRALRACLFKRHDSKDQDVRDLGTSNSQLPACVTVTFQQNGKSYEIRKSFLRSVGASLLEDGREIARAREADEKVHELFGVAAGSGRTIDDAAFGVLWVGQGGSIDAPRIEGRADSLFSALIEEEVGALIGGDRARSVMGQLETELAKYLTKTGQSRTNGPLDVAEKELGRLRSTETELKNRLALLDQRFFELAQQQEELRRLGDQTAIAEVARQLAEAEADLTKGRASASEVRTYESLERAAQAKLTAAEQRLAHLEELITRIDLARVREGELLTDLARLVDREQAARDAVDTTKADAKAVEQELEAIERQRSALQRLRDAATAAKGLDDVKTRLKTVREASNALVAVDAVLAQIRVTQAALAEIEGLERQRTMLEAQLAAAASHLSIDLHAEGAGRVSLGGSIVAAGFSGPVIDVARIEIERIGTITVTPPLADARNASSRRQELAGDLQTALMKVGAENVAEASAAMARRRDLDIKRREIQAELKAHGVLNDNPSGLIASLSEQIAAATLTVQQALTQADLAEIPDDATIEAQLASIQATREELQGRRDALNGTRNAEDQVLEDAMKARVSAETQLAGIRSVLQSDLGARPDATRASELASRTSDVSDARIDHQRAAGALAEQRRQAPDADELERREIRCRRLREQRDNRDSRLQLLRTEIAKLETHIQNAGGEGLGEALGGIQEQRELATRELDRLAARIAALSLLRDTISASLAEGRERYFEPVRRHLRPFLNDLFPGAELRFAEGFEIVGIKRVNEEPFGQLSDGTREQIAVLVRLAMGAMLASNAKSVPIILDDALMFSDDGRIQRMFDALGRAGRQQQVIVLTCRTKAFEQLGGRSLRIEDLA